MWGKSEIGYVIKHTAQGSIKENPQLTMTAGGIIPFTPACAKFLLGEEFLIMPAPLSQPSAGAESTFLFLFCLYIICIDLELPTLRDSVNNGRKWSLCPGFKAHICCQLLTILFLLNLSRVCIIYESDQTKYRYRYSINVLYFFWHKVE